MTPFRFSTYSLLLSSAFIAQASTQFKGSGSVYFAHFPDSPSISEQVTNYASIALNGAMLHTFDNEDQFNLKLFTRFADTDAIRNKSDIAEALYTTTGNSWKLGLGLKKEIWGISQVSRPTNIINPTDTAEGTKLALLMAKATLLTTNGNVNLYVLPRFRTRIYANLEGRPGIFLPVLSDNSTFESSEKENHVDFAIKWSHAIGGLQFDLSQFKGTSRDADLVAGNFVGGKPTTFTPHYQQINQTGLALKYTANTTIWKAELVNRNSKSSHYSAATLGLETPLAGFLNSKNKINLLAEYMTDSRVASIKNPYENDLFIGTKITLKQPYSSSISSGFIFDLDSNEIVFRFKASKNINNQLKLSIDSRVYSNVENDPFFKHFKQDSYLRTTLDYSF